ncbi:prepilin-type N-terminal cleavage/methylation domain-containing protein [Cerasicoccus frondis]|uniref:prepilin-type N-terminal cleavage/methylation domain-containing protein n=1 Tax=Cerasicoccus frondis TaxID=490090 RepID=UPI00285281C8|nr:prepilin-type N-terminal cleavage/methylation domain-containing protein [Cerasicoccus frondis]
MQKLTIKPKNNHSGFTLVELLTIIAIVGVMASLLIPVVGTIRQSAKRSVCASNLRQLSSASLLYSNEHDGELIATPFQEEGKYWFRQVYPYLDNQETKVTSAVFQCPNDESAIQAFENNGTEWNSISYLLLKDVPTWKLRTQISNAPDSPQFIDAETTATTDYYNQTKFTSKVKGSATVWRHDSGVNVAYWDGSVQFIEKPTYEKVFKSKNL